MTQYGTGPQVTEDWGLSTDGKATFVPDNPVRTRKRRLYDALSNRGRGARDMISKLQETGRFAAGVVTADGEVLTATWDVAGLRAALEPAEQAARAMRGDFRRSRAPEDIPV